MKRAVVSALLGLAVQLWNGTASGAAGTGGLSAARELARRGSLDSAWEAVRKVHEKDPRDRQAIFLMAKLSSDGKVSAEYFKKIAADAPASPEAEESYFRLGQYYYATAKYHLAIPYFRDYLRRFPGGDWREPAHYWMGNACLSHAQAGASKRSEYLDSGAAYFQGLLDGADAGEYYSALAWEGLAKIRALRGDRDGALRAARQALEKAPADERGSILLLSAQLRRGHSRSEEKQIINLILRDYPRSPEASYLKKLNADNEISQWTSGSGFEPGQAQTPAAAAASYPQTSPASENRDGPADGDPSHYTLQLGAFSQAEYAREMTKHVAKFGLSPKTSKMERGGKTLYVVRLGRFDSAKEAAEYARKNLKPRKIAAQAVPL